jgi:hypothetical protein
MADSVTLYDAFLAVSQRWETSWPRRSARVKGEEGERVSGRVAEVC